LTAIDVKVFARWRQATLAGSPFGDRVSGLGERRQRSTGLVASKSTQGKEAPKAFRGGPRKAISDAQRKRWAAQKAKKG
jgi:hypothetical protein